ncbi:MAG: hypothetical protein LBE76_06540 [Nitrososphaerota archaeon]|jgi:hypothetical protein|nr:hypothetical protein [Nitrososphaerota archaeon]
MEEAHDGTKERRFNTTRALLDFFGKLYNLVGVLWTWSWDCVYYFCRFIDWFARIGGHHLNSQCLIDGSGRRIKSNVAFLKNTVEGSLPQGMKEIKKGALEGDVEAQYRISRYYGDIWDDAVNMDKMVYVKDQKYTLYQLSSRREKEVLTAYMHVGLYFLHKAIDSGHTEAIAYHNHKFNRKK